MTNQSVKIKKKELARLRGRPASPNLQRGKSHFGKVKTRLNFPKKRFGGFTLVETLVALLILSTGIMGIFVLISRDLSIASLIKNELIASHLTQEGIEVVRNLRDSDWHAERTFGFSIPDGTWIIQWNSSSLMALGSNPVLNKEGASGIYSYDSGTPTLFKRKITISTASGGEEKIITVRIEWVERGVNKLVQAEKHLYNWK